MGQLYPIPNQVQPYLTIAATLNAVDVADVACPPDGTTTAAYAANILHGTGSSSNGSEFTAPAFSATSTTVD